MYFVYVQRIIDRRVATNLTCIGFIWKSCIQHAPIAASAASAEGRVKVAIFASRKNQPTSNFLARRPPPAPPAETRILKFPFA